MKNSKFKMIKKILNFIIFAVILCFIFNKVTWIFRGNHIEARENIQGFINESDLDVVLFGGSDLFMYYQPMEAYHAKGYTSYNYSTLAGKMDMFRFYAEETRKTQEASLYVFNVRTLPKVVERGDTEYSQSVRNWSDSLAVFSPTRIKSLATYLFTRDRENEELPSYFFDIINYHSSYDKLGNPYQWQYTDSRNIDNVDKGFYPNSNCHPFVRPEIVADRGELTELQYNALIALLDYCDKEKLNAIFIVCPYIISEEDWLCLNAAGDIIRDRGYVYVNFNEYYDELRIDFETDFADRNHVNFLGAEKYTKYLMDYLDSNYNLPDHRGEEAYAKWDEDYEEYVKAQVTWKTEIEFRKDSVKSARANRRLLPEINDFEKWYLSAQNSNYSLFIVKNASDVSQTDSVAFRTFVKEIGMDLTKDSYAGVYSGGELIYYANDTVSKEGTIGRIGVPQSVYYLESGTTPSIIVDGYEYMNTTEGIHIVVFDNNYMEVYDSVTLVQNENNQIRLVRD